MVSNISKIFALVYLSQFKPLKYSLVRLTKTITLCLVNFKTRLDREDYRTESLRTSYPYDLNERKREVDPNLSAGCSFPPISRSRQRSSRWRKSVNFDNLKDMESIFYCIHNYITNDLKMHSVIYTYF